MIGKFVLLVFIILPIFMPLMAGNSGARVIFFDIGQGDSALLLGDGYRILIDGGAGRNILPKLGRYLDYGDQDIDLIILSHPHLDHLEGLIDVVERYEYGELLLYPVCYLSRPYGRLLESSEGQFRVARSGEVIKLGGFVIEVLNPSLRRLGDGDLCLEEGKSLNVNNDSLIIRVTYGDQSVLFPGDAELESEGRVVDAQVEVSSEILKAGHHCSKTSSSEAFIEAVNPRVVVCSYGLDNRYGHPSAELIERFEVAGIEVLHTATDGDVVIPLDAVIIDP